MRRSQIATGWQWKFDRQSIIGNRGTQHFNQSIAPVVRIRQGAQCGRKPSWPSRRRLNWIDHLSRRIPASVPILAEICA